MREPVATYRVQLSHAFTFRDLAALAPYLRELGVTDCYCSPVLTARQGSTHGYDICDHAALSRDLGSGDDFAHLTTTLRALGLGLIVDFVPNHMGIDPGTNAWWRDVLTYGAQSEFASFFDIDWLPVKDELRDKVLLPILGDQYGAVLERGELQLTLAGGELSLRYFDRDLPIHPRHAALVFGHHINELAAQAGEHDEAVAAWRAAVGALRRGDAGSVVRVTRILRASGTIRAHVEASVATFNGVPGEPASFDLLHSLLEVQPYRLAYWRTAFDEINYRRFFDVNELGGLRMEDPRVFAATHALLLDLIGQGLVTGVRLDHPDGLFDPHGYLRDLAAAIAHRVGTETMPGIYLVVEKILGAAEELPDLWPVHGTTGYNALNVLNGVFVHSDRLLALRRFYRRYTGNAVRPADSEYAGKRLMMRTAMASELNVLARALSRISETDRRFRDFTLNSLRRALAEVIACFPVYRTYLTAGEDPTDEDRAVIETAISEARRRNPVEEPSIYDFIRHVLLPDDSTPAGARWRAQAAAFAHKFQQCTAPVVAKGIEDTAFYTDVLLVSANEVGGDLRHRARSIAELHADHAKRLLHWPLEMTAGSTHDSKRGEDARARINVISELPEEWRTSVTRWSVINEVARTTLGGAKAPDRNDEWLFYQTLVGTWPAEPADAAIPTVAEPHDVERLRSFMRKALKEAKRHTSWLHENHAYEQAMQDFLGTVLTGSTAAAFLASFLPLQRRLAWFGMLNSLAQVLLRVAGPGVPDTYQGSELWNLTLVDPDNRQAVNFATRRQLLAEMPVDMPAALLEQWPDGRGKLYTLAKALQFRRDHPALLLHGEYEGLTTDEDPHLVAFSRRLGEEELVALVPRFLASMTGGVVKAPLGMRFWRTASIRLPRRLKDRRLLNVLTGEEVETLTHRDVPWLLAGSALSTWPVALLHAQTP